MREQTPFKDTLASSDLWLSSHPTVPEPRADPSRSLQPNARTKLQLLAHRLRLPPTTLERVYLALGAWLRQAFL